MGERQSEDERNEDGDVLEHDLAAEHLLHPARGLAEALFVLDQSDADEAFAFLAEADAGGDGDMGLRQQLLGQLH